MLRKMVVGFLVAGTFILQPCFASNETAFVKGGTFSVKSSDGSYSRLKNLMVCQGDASSSKAVPLLLRFAKIVADDLAFTDQFDVDLKKMDAKTVVPEPKKLFEQGVSLFSTFRVDKDKKDRFDVKIVVRDTSADLVVFDKTLSIAKKGLVKQGHQLSANLLKTLTGDEGVCLSTIAYCEARSSYHKVICLADYACKRSCVVVPTKSINLAPRWHTKVPVLFYSQLTKSNNRLMSKDLRTGRSKVICSYAGLNMQPAFSDDGKQAIICLSGGKGNSELYLYDARLCKRAGKRVFKPLTKNGAHNVSPCMLPSKDVIFCSDYQTGLPQIYYLSRKTGNMTRLTGGKGYCAAPCYCAANNTLVYVRPIQGTFQLFTLCLDNLFTTGVEERQITTCSGSKHEPTWSQCGRYIMFSCDKADSKGRKIPQIAALNYKSGKLRVLTKGLWPKSFPRWTSQQV